MINEINQVLSTEIRPLLAEHNGDIELVNVDNGIIEVKLLGACSGCPSARFTMEDLVERVLLKVPGVTQVKIADSISSEMMDIARKLLKK